MPPLRGSACRVDGVDACLQPSLHTAAVAAPAFMSPRHDATVDHLRTEGSFSRVDDVDACLQLSLHTAAVAATALMSPRHDATVDQLSRQEGIGGGCWRPCSI